MRRITYRILRNKEVKSMDEAYGRYYYTIRSYGIVVLDREDPEWREIYRGFSAASRRVYELNGWKPKRGKKP